MRMRTLLVGMLVLLPCTLRAGVGTQFPRYLATLHYENSQGERGVSFFESDEAGNVIRGLWMLNDGTRSSINHYEAGEEGLIVDAKRTFSDGVTLVETARIEGGRVVAETFDRSDGVKGLARYEYSDDGRVERILCDRAKGWFTGTIVPSYGEGGRMANATILKGDTRVGGISYDYDAGGRLTREHWEFDGTWSQTFVYEYDECPGGARQSAAVVNAFVAAGRPWRMIRETYDYSGENGGPSTFEYDRRGRLAHKSFVRSDGLVTETDYIHDCRGLVRHAWRRYSDGRAAIFTYAFDPRGLMTGRRYVMGDGRTGSETYERDARGVLTGARYEAMDGWLTGRLAFESDEEGHLLAGRFAGDDGSSADLSFRYDGNGNLASVLWTFPNGKTQAYEFEYQPLEKGAEP